VASELDAFQKHLRLIVEGIEKNQLLFRFGVDKSNRESSFVMDVSTPMVYKVLVSTPAIPGLPILVDQLNQSGDLFTFIRQMRAAFVDLAQR